MNSLPYTHISLVLKGIAAEVYLKQLSYNKNTMRSKVSEPFSSNSSCHPRRILFYPSDYHSYSCCVNNVQSSVTLVANKLLSHYLWSLLLLLLRLWVLLASNLIKQIHLPYKSSCILPLLMSVTLWQRLKFSLANGVVISSFDTIIVGSINTLLMICLQYF